MRKKLLMTLAIAALIESPGITFAAQDSGNVSENHLYRNDQAHPHAQPPKGSAPPDRATDRVHPAGDGESIVIKRSSLRTTDRESPYE